MSKPIFPSQTHPYKLYTLTQPYARICVFEKGRLEIEVEFSNILV